MIFNKKEWMLILKWQDSNIQQEVFETPWWETIPKIPEKS